MATLALHMLDNVDEQMLYQYTAHRSKIIFGVMILIPPVFSFQNGLIFKYRMNTF